MRHLIFAVLASSALIACSAEDGAAPQSKTDDLKPASAKAWNAANACGLVSNADVAAAAGVEVTSAQLEGVSAGGGGLAVVSTCRYQLAGGGSITLLARQAPDADATPQAIEAAKTMGGFAPPAETIAGLGKAAFWTPSMKTLQVFIDDTRYVTVAQFQGTGDAQTILTSIARKTF